MRIGLAPLAPWQLSQRWRIHVRWGIIGGAPAQALLPGPGDARPVKLLVVSGAGGAVCSGDDCGT